MGVRFIAFLFCLAIGVSCPAMAEDCYATAKGPEALSSCAKTVQLVVEAELEEAFQALFQKTSPDGQIRLKEAHAAWKTYRDKQCAFDALGSVGDPMHDMVVSVCYEAMARAQTSHLNEHLYCEDGNIYCGHQ